MIDILREWLGPWYLYIKFVHVTFVMVWVWSTAHAYAYFVVPVFKAWRRHPDDDAVIVLRDWVMERFDHGVIYEHVAYPIILITGPLLYIAGGWSTAADWLVLKLALVVLITLPIEVLDYHLSHFGGNKAKIRATGDSEKYEAAIHQHWYFLLYSSPMIMPAALLIIFLAITKTHF
ncbi:hypothetical protein [Parahaliea mediterranea]|uniref:hypothetical protein n=1 Tax=Parahaliea mediterranea TaxID=651086 RepID=UPI000E2FBD99|nr:hypothetical protein [Parahaliea mediterranea]